MIANFFNNSKPIKIFNITVLLFLGYVSSIFLNHSVAFSAVFLIKSAALFLLYILYLMIFKFIVEKNKLTKDNSYGLFIGVALLGIFSEVFFSYEILFSNIILLLSFRKTYSLRSVINTKSKLFDAAFWIGISTLIYAWSILYLLLIFVGIIIYRKVNLKNLLIPLIGFSTPIFIYFTYNFYFDMLPLFYNRFDYTINMNFVTYNSLKLLIPITFLITILLWSIVMVTPKIISVSNHLKISWSVLLNHLIISAVIVVIAPIKNGAEFFYLLFPSAIIITNFLQKSKSRTFKNLILYLFLILAVSVYFL